MSQAALIKLCEQKDERIEELSKDNKKLKRDLKKAIKVLGIAKSIMSCRYSNRDICGHSHDCDTRMVEELIEKLEKK